MGVPTPASKFRSKISLIVQAEPRTINAAIKNLNISVQKVVKSRLVWYAAMVKPQAMFGCESRTCKQGAVGFTEWPEHEDGTSGLCEV